MDGTTGKPEASGSHIWLRYATQFPLGERIYTIEIGIPVPIGASAESRERLMREAEIGMSQLSNHVEGRVAQMLQRNQPVHGAQPSQKTPIPAAPEPVNRPSIPHTPALQASAAASSSLPQASSAVPTRETVQTTEMPAGGQVEPMKKDLAVPPPRPHYIGVGMPATPGIPGEASGNLTLPQFLQFIKEGLALDAKQAMDLLKVKTLSGLNLRDALEQLQHLVMQESTSPSQQGQKLRDVSQAPLEEKNSTAPSVRNAFSPLRSTPAPSFSSAAEAPARNSGIKEISDAVVRDNPPAYAAFNEEIDLDGDEELEYLSELTEGERETAERVLSGLKKAKGSSLASSQRLTALNHLMNSQVSDEQLQQLIQGVWGINSLKRLKNDQVEALISWAKQDDFVGEAESVLFLIQEEQYAGSDR